MTDHQTEYSSYHGNHNLKPIGHKHEFSTEQIQEIIRCRNDYFYFIEKYCYIVDVDNGLVKFSLWDFQRECLNFIHNNRKAVLMMSRQMSKTIISTAYILWYTLFQENKTVAILANKGATAREVVSRYQIMYENLPIWIQQGVKTWNKGDIELENGSRVFTAATSLSAIRGKSINLLYVDEAAIIPNNIAEDFFTSVFPTISSGETTKILISSTPLGYNHFWKLWNEADPKNNKNGFVRLFIEWSRHPRRDAAWAAEQLKTLGELKYNQEVLCAFLGSSRTLISGAALALMSSMDAISSSDSKICIFEEPLKNHVYTIGVDTARGVSGDHSAFTVVDVTDTPYKVVARFRDNTVSPLMYPTYIQSAAKIYNEAYVLVETNDVGGQVADILHEDLEYDNLLWTITEKGRTYLSPGFNTSTKNGILMNKSVKRIGCLALKNLIEKNKLLIFDAAIIHELSTFIENKGSYAADVGYFDDLAMSLVLFGWLTTNTFFKELTNIDLRLRLHEQQMKQAEDEISPFIINSGKGEEEPEIQKVDRDLWLRVPLESAFTGFSENSDYINNDTI